MSGKKRRPPIRIRVGVDEWLTTFADTMTLLLAFFILLYSTSEVESRKVRELGKSLERHFHLAAGTLGFSGQEVDPEAGPEEPGTGGTSGDARPPGDEGRDRIVIQGSLLFAPGSAAIREEAKPSLLRIAARLGRRSSPIKILGHTSPSPLDPSLGIDHDALAYLRAKAVGRFLSGTGGDPGEPGREPMPRGDGGFPAEAAPIDPARFVFASRGSHSPATGRKLWEDPEASDRVELIFLPEAIEEAGGR